MRTVTICTDAFEQMASLEKRVLGQPDLAVAIIEHPLVYRTAEEIEQIADDLMPTMSQIFVESAS
ncbi:MAG: hypothetical protein CL424_02345 [Acidimicrobiaceae bacterium]|nr:hypothetical protein [Acidimicrobiaceae bacterium]